MTEITQIPLTYTAFKGDRRIASGPLHGVAVAVKQANDSGTAAPVVIFDDQSGRSMDIDTSGSNEEMLARLSPSAGAAEPRGRGRPKLGVVSREVTLLPRHWEWLATQPGGASVALRRLVEEARRDRSGKDRIRKAHERAYHFMSAMAGDQPGFEEAIRALFADERPRFTDLVAAWPADVRDYAGELAFGGERRGPPQER